MHALLSIWLTAFPALRTSAVSGENESGIVRIQTPPYYYALIGRLF